MQLTENTITSFDIAKVFKNNRAKINSIDFNKEGDLLVTSSDDESLNWYNTLTGEEQKTIFSKKYGIDLVKFTHHSNAVICASKNGWDESIRYLSLHDNRYLRYFKGHRDRVVSLAMCPSNDAFISGALDDTIRLWDLRSNACQGVLRRRGKPAVAFDPEGLVFSVASAYNAVKLFDLRSFDKGPFCTFQIESDTLVDWSNMAFSDDGKYILVATTEAKIFLIDAFSGQKLQSYTSFVNDTNSMLEVCFSPDNKYVISGSEDGSIHIWETLSGREVQVLNGHVGPVNIVKFSPKYMMLATSCTNLLFWLPKEENNN